MARQTVDHFDTIYDPEEGHWLRPLNQDEIRWIRNERALCSCDHIYALTRYAHIKDWKNEIILFSPNKAQKIAISIIADMEALEREIMLQILKARQLGMSTLTELLIGLRVQFMSGINAVIASNDPDKSLKMSGMVELMWKMMPHWLMPTQTKYKSGVLIEYGNQDSGVSIQHGAQFTGIARGTTVTSVHLSELAEFLDPEELVDASLLRAMHPSPRIFGVFESTASGLDNWWHRTWELSKSGYTTGMSRLCPLFLPWYVGDDIYPSESAKKTRPIPANWIPSTMCDNHAERARSYVRSNDLLRKHLGSNWIMSRDQMWFWEYSREEAKAKNETALFYQEMPATDHEAFQSRNISAFDNDLIAEYREGCTKVPEVYAITGSDIPARMNPDRRDIDISKPTLVIRYRPRIGIVRTFRFIPLKWNSTDSRRTPEGKLLIWEHPKEGYRYGVGIDTGDGLGQDSSVCEVVRKGTIHENDKQCAEWNSPYVNAHDLAPVGLAIACYYRSYNVQGHEGEVLDPIVVIECMGNGESTQHDMRLMGWSNFHQWIRYDTRKLRKNKSTKMGVMMVPWFRSMIMDYLIKFLRDGWCDIYSEYFVSEMQRLERDEYAQKLKANYGGHDDRIMALAVVLFSLHDMELRETGSSLAAERQESRQEEFAVWTPGAQECDADYVEMPVSVITYESDYVQ